MLTWSRRLPLLQVIQHQCKEKISFTTTAIYIFIFSISLLLIALPFSKPIQRLMMARFHLRSQPFVQWAVLQFVPSMYNFENELWISPHLLTPAMLLGEEALPEGTFHRWINHFPLHDVSFDIQHRKFFYEKKQSYVYVRSRYRNVTMTSGYEVKADSRGIHLIRLSEETQ